MKSIFLIIFLFFLSCGDDQKEKVYDDCIRIEDNKDGFPMFSCSFIEIEPFKACHNGYYNQFTKDCRKTPACYDDQLSYCRNGCLIDSINNEFIVMCGLME